MFDRFKRQEESGSIFSTMAPMADVVFLLLIFFMITSAFVLEPGIDVTLPRAVTADEQARDRYVLTITRDRTLLLDDEIVTFEELQGELERAFAGDAARFLVIRADRDVPHGLVVRALDTSRNAGVDSLAIATEFLD